MNIPLIYYPLFPFLKLGITEVIVNLHYLPDLIRSVLHPLTDRLSITYSDERVHLLGSGGAVWKAKHLLMSEDGFVLVNGDEVLLPKDPHFLEKAIQQHRKESPLSTLVTIDHEGLGKKFGAVWCDDKNRVFGFGKQAPRPSLVARHFTGFQILSPRIFDYLPQGESNILYDGVATGIQRDEQVSSYHIHGEWFEVGNQQDFLKTTDALIDRVLLEPKNSQLVEFVEYFRSSQGSGPSISPRAEVSSRTVVADSAVIEDSVQLSGYNVIGHGSRVASGSQLFNTVVLPSVQVPAGTQAESCVLYK